MAHACRGRLLSLQGGRDREGTVARVAALAREHPDLVAGFDFAFGLPAWYCRDRGWRSAPEAWAAIAEEGEALLAACRAPFWGRPARPRPHAPSAGWRRTEREDVRGAKSAFQIGGAGAVGTGSLRGMGHLLTLRDAGWSIWPFLGTDRPMAMEIYPRSMYGPRVRKRRPADREALLDGCFPALPTGLRTRAIASEDAFDAAVSALVMSHHETELTALAPDPAYGLEGRVWVPARPVGPPVPVGPVA